MNNENRLIPVLVSSFVALFFFSLTVIVACKKKGNDNNNPVDLVNCASYTSNTYSDVVSFFTGCGKVWQSVDQDYVPYKSSTGTLYKFKSANSMLYYNMYGVPTNVYYNNGEFQVIENNSQILVVFLRWAGTGPNGEVLDTFKLSIKGKDKVELTNISDKDVTGKSKTGRLGVYTGTLQPDFDNPPPPSSSGGGSGGGSGSVCDNAYSDPTTDGQLNAYCSAAYLYRCKNGEAVSSSNVQYVCNAYNQLKYSGAPDCKYCQ